MSRDDLTSRLMSSWKFDQTDLDANHKGYLSDRQLEIVREGHEAAASMVAFSGRAFLIVFIIMLLVGIFMLNLLIRSNNLPISPVVPVVIGAVLVLALVVVIFSQRGMKKYADDAKSAPIELLSVTGPAKYISGRSRQPSGYSAHWAGVEIDGIQFISFDDGSQQKVFAEGGSYRVYYTVIPYGKRKQGQLWSAEAM